MNRKTNRVFTRLMLLLTVLSMLTFAASAETAEGWAGVTDTSEAISISDLFKVPDAEEEEAEATSESSVRIFSSFTGVIGLGDLVTLTSEVDGEVAGYQWECDQGNGFEPVEGATEPTYAFEATADSLRWSWRLTVARPAE